MQDSHLSLIDYTTIVHKTLGKAWVNGARGPHQFDCWGLVCWVREKFYGGSLPLYPVNAKDLTVTTKLFGDAANGPLWRKLTEPLDGCVVALSRNCVIHHVGIYLAVDGGIVLHSYEGHGVVAQKLSSLTSHGWRKVEFYKHFTW